MLYGKLRRPRVPMWWWRCWGLTEDLHEFKLKSIVQFVKKEENKKKKKETKKKKESDMQKIKLERLINILTIINFQMLSFKE